MAGNFLLPMMFSLDMIAVAFAAVALARIYARTGHARIWSWFCLAVAAPAVLACLTMLAGFFAPVSGGGLPVIAVMICAPLCTALALLLAFKNWPTDIVTAGE